MSAMSELSIHLETRGPACDYCAHPLEGDDTGAPVSMFTGSAECTGRPGPHESTGVAPFTIGEPVILHKYPNAPYSVLWTVALWRRDRGLWRLQEPDFGTYVDARESEMIRPGRPDVLDRAAAIAPLHLWGREEFRFFAELPAGLPCSECGRPRMT